MQEDSEQEENTPAFGDLKSAFAFENESCKSVEKNIRKEENAFRHLKDAFGYNEDAFEYTDESKNTEKEAGSKCRSLDREYSCLPQLPIKSGVKEQKEIQQKETMHKVIQQGEKPKIVKEKAMGKEKIDKVIFCEQQNVDSEANFSIRLVGIKELIREESDGEFSRTMYCFAILMGNQEYVQEVEPMELEKFDWVKKATNGRAYMKNAKSNSFKKLVHNVLEAGLREGRSEIYYLTNGWKRLKDGSYAYVCNHGIVGQSNQLIHGCDELQFQIDTEVTALQNFQNFMGMERITKEPEFSRCFITFGSLGMMTSLFEKAGFPVKFILGVLGTTNTMKTSVSLVFTSVFNAVKPQKPEVTFSSTKSGIETMVSQYSDAVLLVDDFMPADSRKKQVELNDKLELLCRLYGDRTPKKRMLDF